MNEPEREREPVGSLRAPIIAGLMLMILAASAAGQARAAEEDVSPRVDKVLPALLRLYRHLHQNPEVSFEEKETADRLSKEVADSGFEVSRGIGGEGFVGILRNGPGPVLMLRTDLDALPLEEKTGAEYASKKKGVMHACGHDVHMTVFAGAARLLANMRERWSGTLLLVGQPAEERGAGARAMIEDGLFDRFPRPDQALAFHVDAAAPAGTIGVCEGFALASVDMVDLVVYGEGGHGAYPHTTKDPIVMASEIVMSLQTIVSRELSPLEPAVVTVGSFHGGTKHNIIPSEAKLELTCRSYSDDVRKAILEKIEHKAKAIARSYGMPEDRLPVMTVRNESIPSTYNDPELTRRVAAIAKKAVGEDRVLKKTPVMGGEDFGMYRRCCEPPIPTCILWLGAIDPRKVEAAKNGGKPLPSMHSPYFIPLAGPTIKAGVVTMVTAALDLLKPEGR